MQISSISFSNYKAFSEKQTLQIKPITLLIGKNSAGKSSITKLFPLLENALSYQIQEPILLTNHQVELGSQFRDLVFNRQPQDKIELEIKFSNGNVLAVEIFEEKAGNPKLRIISWVFTSANIKLHLRYQNEQHLYVNKPDGEKYDCEFSGILPTKIINTQTNENLVNRIPIKEMQIEVDYIGPFRVLPERQFYMNGRLRYTHTGSKGENAYSMLGVSKLINNRLHEKVGLWYKKHFDSQLLKVKEKDAFLEIVLENSEGTEINLSDVGQGIHQSLPLVVRANLARENSIVVLEQPELHLHPAAHGDLAELFAQSAKENRQSFVIETHSEIFLLRLRRLIVEQKYGFTANDLVIYWVNDAEGQGKQVEEITVNERGVLSDWPEGVFSEDIQEIAEIRKALNPNG